MKTVVISGYYGYENIGDEALLASIIGALRDELRDLRIIVLSARPEQTAKRYGVEAVDRMGLFAIVRALYRADLLISGGGSLLQDVTGPLTIPYYLSIVVIAKMLGKPVMFYAQGIGPVHKGFGRLLVKLIADRVDMITLRDPASGELLRQLGVNTPPVELTADPVFGMKKGHFDLTGVTSSLGLPFPQAPTVGVFVREWQNQSGYKQAIAGLADSLLEQKWNVVFVPMQYPADIQPAREIAGLMKYTPTLVERALNLDEVTGLVGSMDIVVGMRLHALIIATVCGVPMVGLSYDPKVADFLDGIGQPVIKDLESVTCNGLRQKVEEILYNKEGIKKELSEIRSQLRQKALRNSKLAVELLNKKVR